MDSLWGLRDLSAAEIEDLLDPNPIWDEPLRDPYPTVAFLLLEPSTRTWGSFHMAGQSLGANFLYISPDKSSLTKGETIEDTVRNLTWMGVGAVVLRTSEDGLPERLAKKGLPVINAGDGVTEHPTQALLDAYTIREHFGDLKGLTVLIAGDVARSRVARSNIYALSKLGAEVLISCPETYEPLAAERVGFEEGLRRADAVMMLRWQWERTSTQGVEVNHRHTSVFALNEERAELLQDHAVILHPGPVNYGAELTEELARGPRSLISRQVANGVQVRTRVLRKILTHRRR